MMGTLRAPLVLLYLLIISHHPRRESSLGQDLQVAGRYADIKTNEFLLERTLEATQ